jgi:hypothetical protein
MIVGSLEKIMRMVRHALKTCLLLTLTISALTLSLAFSSIARPDLSAEFVYDLHERVEILFALSGAFFVLIGISCNHLLSRNIEYQQQMELMIREPDAISTALKTIGSICILSAIATFAFTPTHYNVELGASDWIARYRSRPPEIITAEQAKDSLWIAIRFLALISCGWLSAGVLVIRMCLKVIKKR